MIRPLLWLAAWVCLAGCTTAEPSPAPLASNTAPAAPAAPAPAEVAGSSRASVAEPAVVGTREIRFSYAGAEGAPPAVKRPRAEAKEAAEQALVRLRTGRATFDELVVSLSDDPNAKSTMGAVGSFDRSVMPRAYADAAFALAIDEVSSVIDDPRGYYIILRVR